MYKQTLRKVVMPVSLSDAGGAGRPPQPVMP
jgi:hypothetical protein